MDKMQNQELLNIKNIIMIEKKLRKVRICNDKLGIKNSDKDVLKNVNKDWIISAQNANTFKKRYECTKGLMERVCGDSSKIPPKFNKNTDPSKILMIFAKWLNVETHIVVRKHILQLLISFGQTNYNVSVWRECIDDMVQNLMNKQWIEKKRGFVPFATVALIAIYMGHSRRF